MSGLPEALETAREAGEVLSAAVLSQENAEGLDGSGLDFRDCRFQSCRLRNCDFTGAAFYGCTFTGCLLENCRLSATYWKDCRLSGCKWDGADLRRSRWKDSVLEETLLRYVNFSGGVWERISVKECDFTESTLSEMRLKKAAIELKSMAARFEVGTVKPGTGLDALTVEAVYLNNFYLDHGRLTAQEFTELTWPTVYTPAWATDGYNAAVTSNAGTKVYAYQVLLGDKIPHIIYKVSGTVSAGYKLSDGTGDMDNPTPFTDMYITVKGFRENGSLLTTIEGHKIYKMGLADGGIAITPDKITPDPEKNKIDLIVAITVADWTSSNVTPEF